MKYPILALPIFLSCVTAAPAAVSYYYAHPYYGRSDSPFYRGIVDGTIYLEDFEDYRLSTPYVSSTGGGWVADSPADSVDEDDGKDGVWNKGGGAWRLRPSDRILPEFTFSRNAEGLLPSYVGMALLGGVIAAGGEALYSQIWAYDADGVEITGGEWKLLVQEIPPELILGGHGSSGDRFAGIYFPEGVARIKIGWALIDHLQYGYAIPEPSAAGLLAVAGCFGLASRRRGAPRFRAPTPSSSAAAPPPPMPG